MKTTTTYSNGLFWVTTEGQCTARGFKSLQDYEDWLKEVETNGHSLVSFYKIAKMVQQYHPFTPDEIKEL